ncbi:hypothetical protein M885DRAFT_627131 [Pelagophyceae sp. CCMP2097]|nr:hypothetical protein M885DRAFT_627131 [Pelagophyceae sp. CCMP2097]
MCVGDEPRNASGGEDPLPCGDAAATGFRLRWREGLPACAALLCVVGSFNVWILYSLFVGRSAFLRQSIHEGGGTDSPCFVVRQTTFCAACLGIAERQLTATKRRKVVGYVLKVLARGAVMLAMTATVLPFYSFARGLELTGSHDARWYGSRILLAAVMAWELSFIPELPPGVWAHQLGLIGFGLLTLEEELGCGDARSARVLQGICMWVIYGAATQCFKEVAVCLFHLVGPDRLRAQCHLLAAACWAHAAGRVVAGLALSLLGLNALEAYLGWVTLKALRAKRRALTKAIRQIVPL